MWWYLYLIVVDSNWALWLHYKLHSPIPSWSTFCTLPSCMLDQWWALCSRLADNLPLYRWLPMVPQNKDPGGHNLKCYYCDFTHVILLPFISSLWCQCDKIMWQWLCVNRHERQLSSYWNHLERHFTNDYTQMCIKWQLENTTELVNALYN